jgi:hypothetical protein
MNSVNLYYDRLITRNCNIFWFSVVLLLENIGYYAFECPLQTIVITLCVVSIIAFLVIFTFGIVHYPYMVFVGVCTGLLLGCFYLLLDK